MTEHREGLTAEHLRSLPPATLFRDVQSGAEFRKLDDNSFTGGGETWSEKGDADHFAGRLTFYAGPPPKPAIGGLITSGPGPVTTINAPASAVPIVLRTEDLDLTFTALADLLRPAADRIITVGPEATGKRTRAWDEYLASAGKAATTETTSQGGTVHTETDVPEPLAHQVQRLTEERDKAAGSALSARAESARRRIENRDLRAQVEHLNTLLNTLLNTTLERAFEVADERDEAAAPKPDRVDQVARLGYVIGDLQAENERLRSERQEWADHAAAMEKLSDRLRRERDAAQAEVQGPDRVRGMQRKIAAQRAAITVLYGQRDNAVTKAVELGRALAQEKHTAAEADQTHRAYLALRVGELESTITAITGGKPDPVAERRIAHLQEENRRLREYAADLAPDPVPVTSEDRIEAARERRAADAGNDLPAGPTLGVEQLEALAVGSEVVTGDDIVWAKAVPGAYAAMVEPEPEEGVETDWVTGFHHDGSGAEWGTSEYLAALNPRLRKLVAEEVPIDPWVALPADAQVSLVVRTGAPQPAPLSLEELKALPAGSEVCDRVGDVWTRSADRQWRLLPQGASYSGPKSRALLDMWGPLRLVHRESDQQ